MPIVRTKYTQSTGPLNYIFCTSCGTVYSDWLFESDTERDLIYKTPYQAVSLEEYLNDTKVRLRRNRYRHQWFCRTLRSGSDSKKSALEIGSKDGSFLWLLSQRGWCVTGIDPNETYNRYARQHYGVDVRTGYFDSQAFRPDSFDMVASFHVIEHIDEPRPFLSSVWESLAENGILYLETPNVRTIQQRQLAQLHVVLYDQESLGRLLENCGFEVLAFTGCAPGNFTFDQLAVIAVKTKKSPPIRPPLSRTAFASVLKSFERAMSDDFPNTAIFTVVRTGNWKELWPQLSKTVCRRVSASWRHFGAATAVYWGSLKTRATSVFHA